MSHSITDAQRNDYLEANGMACPYCSSDDITTIGDVEFGEGCCCQSVKCLTCNARWTDTYTLTDVEEE